MATRIYLPSSGAAPISPAYDSGWEITAEASRLAAVTTKIGSSMADASITDTSTGSDADCLIRQWVIGPLAAQTIAAQTVEIQIRANEIISLQNLFLAWGIRVVSADGATVRGSVVPLRRDGTELVSGMLTNRRDTLTSTAVAAQAGDYLVIEIGTGGSPSYVGRRSVIRIGDAAASDLPEDDSTTTDLNPWVEFANDLTFQTFDVTLTPGAGSLSLTAQTPTSAFHYNLTPSNLSAALSAQTPTLMFTTNVSPGVLEQSLTAFTPTLIKGGDFIIQPGAGLLTLSAQTANLRLRIFPGSLSAGLSAQTASLRTTVFPGNASAVLTGFVVSVRIIPLTFGRARYAPMAVAEARYGVISTGAGRYSVITTGEAVYRPIAIGEARG